MEADLKDELEKPLDITKEGGWKTVRMEDGSKQKVWLSSGEDILASSGIVHWREDVEHLRNQLKVEQPGTVDSLDFDQKRRDDRKMKESVSREKKRLKEEEARIQVTDRVAQEDDEDKENIDEDDNLDMGEDFKVRTVNKKRKVDIMGPVSTVVDRLNLSSREMAVTSAATVKALGVEVADTNISVSTAWRKRTKGRLELASSIKESFVPSKFLALHWDGKTLNLVRGEKGNFVAVYIAM